MTERAQVLSLQLLGFVAVVCTIALAAHFAPIYPALASTLAALVAAFAGKLFGAPLPIVTLDSVRTLDTQQTAKLALRALDSLPPQAQADIHQGVNVEVVLSGLSEPPPPPAARG